MIVTLDRLFSLKACKKERNLFYTVFGEELKLPEEKEAQHKLAVLLHENRFDRVWCLSHLMWEEQRDKYFEITEDTMNSNEWNIRRWKIVIQILTGTLEQK